MWVVELGRPLRVLLILVGLVVAPLAVVDVVAETTELRGARAAELQATLDDAFARAPSGPGGWERTVPGAWRGGSPTERFAVEPCDGSHCIVWRRRQPRSTESGVFERWRDPERFTSYACTRLILGRPWLRDWCTEEGS